MRFLSYAAGSNPLKNILPAWVQAGGVEAMIARLGKCETRQKIRADIARDGLNNWGRIPSWDCVQISISPHLPQFSGRTIASFAAERGADPIDTLCDYLADDQGATRVLVTSISEADIRTIVASPLALVGSDGNCVAPYGTVGKGMPHPRFYGTFPRILSRYVRDENALPLALAIHKMTGATARALKLKDRGLLREGFCADVVLFDPDDFTDRATYADPHQFPSGARTTVIVNGTLVVENATHTGALPGTVLRRDAGGAVADRASVSAALGFPMAGALVARRAADPGAFAIIARQPAGAGRALPTGTDRDADLAAGVDLAVHVETRIVVVNPAVGDVQRIAIATVAAAGIGDDRYAPIAVELRDRSAPPEPPAPRTQP